MRLTKDDIEPFNGSNYGTWSQQVRFKLMEKGLWNFVDQAPLECKRLVNGDHVTLETEESDSYQARVTVEVRERTSVHSA